MFNYKEGLKKFDEYLEQYRSQTEDLAPVIQPGNEITQALAADAKATAEHLSDSLRSSIHILQKELDELTSMIKTLTTENSRLKKEVEALKKKI